MKPALLLLAVLLASSAIAHASSEAGKPSIIVVANVNGYISRATLEYVAHALRVAEHVNAEAVLITLNTPGGELSSTEKIIELLTTARKPTICYVYPRGAEALSAGTYILEACDIAAAAPYAIIGAGQPVLGVTPLNQSKYVNPLIARLSVLMKMHGRNYSLAERIVRENLVVDSGEAAKIGLVNVVSDNISELLEAVNGYNVPRLEVTLRTSYYSIYRVNQPIGNVALSYLSNPTISGILLTVGMLLLVFGLSTPGLGAEIAGAILFVLGLVGMGIDANLVALALIAIGGVLLFYELTNPGFGAAGIGGVIAILLGGFLAATRPFTPTLISISYLYIALTWLFAALAVLFAFFLLIIYKAIKAVRRKDAYSYDLLGNIGRAIDDIDEDKEGYVVVKGEYWKARSKKRVEKGSLVRVLGRNPGGVLEVEPYERQNES